MVTSFNVDFIFICCRTAYGYVDPPPSIMRHGTLPPIENLEITPKVIFVLIIKFLFTTFMNNIEQ